MDNKEFKIVFGDIAKLNGFEQAFGGWFKDSNECIIVLDLQKSYYSNLYYLNVKIFIQGMFGNTYRRSKDMVKKDLGDIFTRSPQRLNDPLDIENPMSDEERKTKLKTLFNEFIIPFTQKAMSVSGINELEAQGIISILPAVKERL